MTQETNQPKITETMQDQPVETVAPEESKTGNGHHDFGERVGYYAQKGAAAVKTGVNMAAEFTGSAAHLARLKMQIHSLQSSVEKEYMELGKKLYSLREADKVDNVKTFFIEDLSTISALEEEIEIKKAEASQIHLIKGSDNMEDRNAYIDKLAVQLKAWNKDIDALQTKANKAKDDMKSRYNEEVQVLKEKRDVAQKQLKDLREAGSSAWKDIQSGAEASWSELEKAVKAAKDKF